VIPLKDEENLKGGGKGRNGCEGNYSLQRRRTGERRRSKANGSLKKNTRKERDTVPCSQRAPITTAGGTKKRTGRCEEEDLRIGREESKRRQEGGNRSGEGKG